MKGFCPLASGSKGNCIVYSSGSTTILIDAGLSGRATLKGLATLNIDISEIDAILITHEHSDHIAGLKILAIKYGIPVLANSETAKAIYHILGECPQFKIFTTGDPFDFGDLHIHPFAVQHDTVEPVAFTIETGDHKAGFCTDLGFATTLVKSHLQNCHTLYLEANHQPEMVHACPRPMVYKQRVLSRSGHLSNQACGELLSELLHDKLRHVTLAHLSEECNSEPKALEVVSPYLQDKDIPLAIARQKEIGQVVQLIV